MDFLRANVQLATPFHSLLRVRHSTDRRTDTRRPLVHNAPSLWGRGRHKSHNNAAAVRMTHIWTCVSWLFTLHILLMFFFLIHSLTIYIHSFSHSVIFHTVVGRSRIGPGSARFTIDRLVLFLPRKTIMLFRQFSSCPLMNSLQHFRHRGC